MRLDARQVSGVPERGLVSLCAAAVNPAPLGSRHPVVRTSISAHTSVLCHHRVRCVHDAPIGLRLRGVRPRMTASAELGSQADQSDRPAASNLCGLRNHDDGLNTGPMNKGVPECAPPPSSPPSPSGRPSSSPSAPVWPRPPRDRRQHHGHPASRRPQRRRRPAAPRWSPSTAPASTSPWPPRGLLADNPHAAHIHFGADARHECPAAEGRRQGRRHHQHHRRRPGLRPHRRLPDQDRRHLP